LLKRPLLWLPPLLYMAVIFHLSSESAPLPELTSHVWDKLLHAIEYGGLALLVCRALAGEGLGWRASVLLAVAFASIYGATDEFHQLFVPGRDSSVVDWTADAFGSTLGALAYAGVIWMLAESR
jgi:VanZ family protein